MIKFSFFHFAWTSKVVSRFVLWFHFFFLLACLSWITMTSVTLLSPHARFNRQLIISLIWYSNTQCCYWSRQLSCLLNNQKQGLCHKRAVSSPACLMSIKLRLVWFHSVWLITHPTHYERNFFIIISRNFFLQQCDARLSQTVKVEKILC